MCVFVTFLFFSFVHVILDAGRHRLEWIDDTRDVLHRSSAVSISILGIRRLWLLCTDSYLFPSCILLIPGSVTGNLTVVTVQIPAQRTTSRLHPQRITCAHASASSESIIVRLSMLACMPISYRGC